MHKSLSLKLDLTHLSAITTGLVTESNSMGECIMSVGVLFVLLQSSLNLLGLSFNFIITPCLI